MALHIIRDVESVQSVDADQQHMFNAMVPVALGMGDSSEKRDGQGN